MSTKPSTGASDPTHAPIRGIQTVDDQTVIAFGTPVFSLRWSDTEAMNKSLCETVLNARHRNEGVVRSNVGGWHSTTGFLDLDTDAVAELRTRLHALIADVRRRVLPPTKHNSAGQVRLEGWANVLGFGQYNTMHCHPNAVWSGVYYLTDNPKIAEHPFSGKLELVDPRPGAALEYHEESPLYGRFLLSPVAGQVILFPSWLNHIVHPYFGDALRISVAFNVKVDH